MPKYIANWNLGLNGKNYAPGDIVKLSLAEAENLGAVVSPFTEAEQDEGGGEVEVGQDLKGKV